MIASGAIQVGCAKTGTLPASRAAANLMGENAMMRTILSSLAVAAMVLTTTEVTAHHSKTPHPFKNASISWDPGGQGREAPVRIFVSHDGEEYTQIAGNVETRFRLQAKVKAFHRIINFSVTLFGDNTGHDPTGIRGAVTPPDKKSINRHRTFVMSAREAIRGAFGITAETPEQQFVRQCNERFKGNLPTEDELLTTIDIEVHAWFGARRLFKGNSGTALAHTSFPASIICRRRPAHIESAPKPESIDIRVKQAGKHCPARTEVTAYIDYLKKASPRIRAVRQGHVGRAVPFVTAETRQVSLFGKTWHRVEHTFEYELDPGKHSFRIEVEGGPNTPWATVEIDCPPFEIVFTSLEYDVEEKKSCPKLVEETIIFTTNGPGEIDYEVKVAGSDWFGRKGTVQSVRDGDGYLAVVERIFPQDKEINVFMTVEATRISGPNEPGGLANAFASLKVECVPESQIPSGADGMAEPPRPEPSGDSTVVITPPPPSPKVITDPPVPQLVCTGGRVVGSGRRASCRCPRGQEAKQVGRNRFQCERTVARITCAGGTVRRGECFCARNLRKVQTGRNAWRCERSAAKTRPDTTTIRPAAKTRPDSTRPARRVICHGGTVRRGECVCPRGTEKAPMAPANAYRCVGSTPQRGSTILQQQQRRPGSRAR